MLEITQNAGNSGNYSENSANHPNPCYQWLGGAPSTPKQEKYQTTGISFLPRAAEMARLRAQLEEDVQRLERVGVDAD